MSIDIFRLYWFVDEFSKNYKKLEKANSVSKKGTRNREIRPSLSELLTIVIMFGFSPIKNFKLYYTKYIPMKFQGYFTELSYSRMVELLPRLMVPLSILLHCMEGRKTGIYFADSTKIAVCHNKRINQNKVFKDLAKMSKSTMGWFFGFKLHMIINDRGEIMAVKITQGNVDDREPMPSLLDGLKGLCFADKGYVKAELFSELYKKGVKLITPIKDKMKNKLMLINEKFLLKKRSVIESVFNVLKSQFNLEHTRHRSSTNAFVFLLSGLVGYCFKSSKPSIKNFEKLALIPN